MNFGFKNFDTQGVRYTGSKLKLLPKIFEIADSLNIKSVCDGFSGSTRVSQCLAKNKYKVFGNDISELSFLFNTVFLLNKDDKNQYELLIKKLNNIKPIEGWFSENYGFDGTNKRPFSKQNMMITDAILNELNNVSEKEKNIVLVSLILALDKVDNTIGHFSSYFNGIAERANNKLILEIPNLWINKEKNEVFKNDIINIIKNINCDLVYYDPPYGSCRNENMSSRVRYASYYHFWKTLILNDKPKLFGKANRREDTRDLLSYNPYEDFRKDCADIWIAEKTIKNLIEQTPQKYILFSYSNEGRVPKENLIKIFKNNCIDLKITEVCHSHNSMKNMSKQVVEKNKLIEYLFLLKR